MLRDTSLSLTVAAMNRFVVGRRLYQRDGVWITFSMKPKKLDKKAKLAAVKMQMEQVFDPERCAPISPFVRLHRSEGLVRLPKSSPGRRGRPTRGQRHTDSWMSTVAADDEAYPVR